MKAKSRLKKFNKLARIRVESSVLALLLITYAITKLIPNLHIFQPIQALSDPYTNVLEVEKQVEVVREVEVDRKFTTQKQQILAYIVEVFGDDADDAITIINKCENSSFNPEAENWNSNGTWDAGIFQVNEVHGYTMEEMKDWKQNVDAAYKIFKSRGWEAWSCSHVVGVKSFWQ